MAKAPMAILGLDSAAYRSQPLIAADDQGGKNLPSDDRAHLVIDIRAISITTTIHKKQLLNAATRGTPPDVTALKTCPRGKRLTARSKRKSGIVVVILETRNILSSPGQGTAYVVVY